MNGNFTPGPWSVFFTECGLGNIAQRKFTVSGGGHSVAGCFCTAPDKNDENDANGYLISAAPEMYELLDCIRKSVALDAGIMASCIARIEPLLKKARGEK